MKRNTEIYNKLRKKDLEAMERERAWREEHPTPEKNKYDKMFEEEYE